MKTQWEVEGIDGVADEYLECVYWANITSENFKFTYILAFWTLAMWV
jgi:hypothetical protein